MKRFGKAGQAVAAFWQGRTPAQRRQLASAGMLLAVVILVAGILMPLNDSRQRLARSIQAERQRTASMAAVQSEIERLAKLPRATSAPQGEALRAQVEASARAAFAPAAVSVTLEGSAIKVRANGIVFERVAPWLDAARRADHVRLQRGSIRPESGATCTIELELAGTDS